jgi:hypothetical protein
MASLAWCRITALAVVLCRPCITLAADGDESPHASDVDVDDSVPVGWHRETQLRQWALTAGLLASTGGYVAAVGVATLVRASNLRASLSDWLYVPVAGPFVVASRFTFGRHSTLLDDGLVDFVLLIDGGIQIAGHVLLAYGLASGRPVLVPDRAGTFRIAPVPMAFGAGAVGAGAVGTF